MIIIKPEIIGAESKLERIGKIPEIIGMIKEELPLNQKLKPSIMPMLQLEVTIMEAEMMPMEIKPVDLDQDIRTNRRKEETNRVGVRLEKINSAMQMIGLIREAVWEVQILKLGVKEM